MLNVDAQMKAVKGVGDQQSVDASQRTESNASVKRLAVPAPEGHLGVRQVIAEDSLLGPEENLVHRACGGHRGSAGT